MAEPSSPGAPAGGTADYVPARPASRMIVTVIAILVATNAVTALTVYYVAQPPPAAVQPLRVIGPWGGSEKDKFIPVLNSFKNQTGIDFEFISIRQESLQSDLPNWFAARRAPGDLIFMPVAFVRLYGTQGHAIDLAATITQSNYQAGALDPVKDGDKLYGGVYTGKVKPGFWYRQSFFTQNNLQVPTTWAGFTALLADIDTRGLVTNEPIISGDSVGWPLSDVAEHFIASYGGPSMHRNLTAGTQSWTDASVRSVFANYLVPTLTRTGPGAVCAGGCWSAPRQWDTGVTEWWGGAYAFYFMGSWITGMVPDPLDLRVLALPEARGPAWIQFAADFFFVPTYAARPDAAKQLAAFLGTAAAQTEQVKVGGHLATVTGVPTSAYPTVDATVLALMSGKDLLGDLDDAKGNPFQANFWSQLQGLWVNPAALDTVLASIQSEA